MRLAFWRKADGVQGPQNPQAVAQPAQAAQAQRANQAAQAALGQMQKPSLTSRAWTWTKDNAPRIAYTAALIAAAALMGVGIPTGALSAVAIAGYSLAGAALLGATIYEVKQARNLDNHAKELYKAVKEFDDLNPASNKYLTAQQRYFRAQDRIKEDLIRMNPADKDAFIRRVASTAFNDPHFRINIQDGRYGVVIEGQPRGATFTEFVSILVQSHADEVQAAYDQEIASYSETFTDVLRNDDVNLCKKLRHEINRAAYKMAGKKDYRILGKSQEDVVQDLHNAIKDRIGGERKVRREISRLGGLMTDRYDFWSDVEKVRKGIRKDFYKRYREIEKEIKALEKELQDLNDAEMGLEKRKVSLRAIVRNTNNTAEQIQAAQDEIDRIDARRAEIEAKKEEKRQIIASLKNEQAILEGRIGYDHIVNLNAKRRELSRFLGQDLVDIDLPGYPTFGDKVKYWAPRVAITGATVGATVAGAYYGYPYVEPYVGPYVTQATTAATGAATGAWASFKEATTAATGACKEATTAATGAWASFKAWLRTYTDQGKVPAPPSSTSSKVPAPPSSTSSKVPAPPSSTSSFDSKKQ